MPQDDFGHVHTAPRLDQKASDSINRPRCPDCNRGFHPREARDKANSRDPNTGQDMLLLKCPYCGGIWRGYRRERKVQATGFGAGKR